MRASSSLTHSQHLHENELEENEMLDDIKASKQVLKAEQIE